MSYACIDRDLQRDLIAAPDDELRVGALDQTFAFDGGNWRPAGACRRKWKTNAIEMAVNKFGERQRESEKSLAVLN